MSNAPKNSGGFVSNFTPLIAANGVVLLKAPVKGACLSSGFGPRGSRQHKGIDYHQRPGGPVFAAGDGVIVEQQNRRDYGRMLLIDHGSGVYTRYAHLNHFGPGVRVGARVSMGSALGIMGSTGRTNAVHLHYEILTGNYNNPNGSYGLKPHNPFANQPN